MNKGASKSTELTDFKRVLIIVENLSVPFDRRVWRECSALREAGYQVSVISPMGTETDNTPRERIDGVSIYRYKNIQATGTLRSYIVEYAIALAMSFWLALVVLIRDGYEVIQICNPPDVMILAILPFKIIGKKIIFDQHDTVSCFWRAVSRRTEKGGYRGSGRYQGGRLETAMRNLPGVFIGLCPVFLSRRDVQDENCP